MSEKCLAKYLCSLFINSGRTTISCGCNFLTVHQTAVMKREDCI